MIIAIDGEFVVPLLKKKTICIKKPDSEVLDLNTHASAPIFSASLNMLMINAKLFSSSIFPTIQEKL